MKKKPNKKTDGRKGFCDCGCCHGHEKNLEKLEKKINCDIDKALYEPNKKTPHFWVRLKKFFTED